MKERLVASIQLNDIIALRELYVEVPEPYTYILHKYMVIKRRRWTDEYWTVPKCWQMVT